MPVHGHYKVECVRDGVVIWTEEFDNLVVNTGKADILEKYFRTTTTYTTALFMGLIVGGIAATAISAADTSASHAGWTESSAYSAGTRPAPTFNAATGTGGGSNSAGTGSIATTATSFSINGTVTVGGVGMWTNNTKGGTTGTLISAGLFTGGDRATVSGDTLNVTWTATN
jgi:hypothetical protein